MNETLVTNREVPWMKLGKITDTVMTSAEAIVAGGLDFTVSKRNIQFSNGDDWIPAPKRMMIVRDDTNEPFESVAANYPVYQYGEAFDFMDGVNPSYVACGSLKGGRQGFMVTKLPSHLTSFVPVDDDPHDMFAILRTSHNKTLGIEISLMMLRGKCMNSLGLVSFSKDAPQRWSIIHSGNIAKKLHDAELVLHRADAYQAAYTDIVQRLVSVKMRPEDGRKVLTSVVRKAVRQDEVVASILSLWRTDPTIAGHEEDGWGLVNAVSSYYEWERKASTDQSRMLNVIEGTTRSMINKTTARVLMAA